MRDIYPEDLDKIIEAIKTLRTKATDEDALSAKEIYPEWRPGLIFLAEDVNKTRLFYNNKLWKVRQVHTSQIGWEPGIATASLYTEITLSPGTHDNPIEYSGNMELTEGLYYTEGGILYLCIRSTGVPVYNPLSALVGIYVEVSNG